ncbi:hypothetical protein OFO07_02630 [Campylobacter sp. JMF_06 NA1]|uniref:hypothetical protein n=1 Tax=Campylobacter sp. JMF_06 NA1 TaxID=2983823 RepID=UPI0022EA0976|nr:hypothetical protein [Campylobacter sp. JMF_06 NA1]MDA3077822.1 hypothetical protein [Campylobacter sp. JMF_06 NA1]
MTLEELNDTIARILLESPELRDCEVEVVGEKKHEIFAIYVDENARKIVVEI